MSTDDKARVIRTSTGNVHFVLASGGPEDGSLFGFLAVCGRAIRNLDAWREDPGAAVTCKICLRVDALVKDR